ncbi:hypothetical protein ABZ721_29545 [Streptomyces sp. NPDC006733]|uniref:hypothetical protein n=1 Tax=Streptomyces sp. NPDC006733 TaxID=3155460 RepID=UPI0033D5CBE0
MIRRVGLFVRGSYPLPLSAVFATAWALGVTGLFAALTPGAPAWRPDAGTAVAAVSVTLDLLLMRVADDLRDAAYDRLHHPDRALASGAVHARDLVVLFAAGSAVLLALNAGNGPAVLILTGQLLYTVGLVAAELRFGWPPGDAVVLSVLLSSPVQVLLNGYLYAVFLRSAGVPAHGPALLAGLAVVLLAAFHHEVARKVLRSPGAGARTYVQVFGLRATTVIAVAFAVASAATGLAALRPWAGGPSAWGWLVVLPLLLVAGAARRFVHGGAPRWPLRAVLAYLLTTFACYAVIGLGVTA